MKTDSSQELAKKILQRIPAVIKNIRSDISIRKRFFTPEMIIQMFVWVSLLKDSFDAAVHHLNEFYSLLKENGLHENHNLVTRQAWCEARQRTPLAFLISAFSEIVNQFCLKFDSAMRWKGFRLLAADGTCVPLPSVPDLKRIFGGATGSRCRGRAMIRMVCLVSVFTGLCVDFTIGAYTASEKMLFMILLGALRPDDLVLLDRGYHSIGLIGTMLNRRLNFLVRIKSCAKVKKVKELGAGDWLCEFTSSTCAKEKYPDCPESFVARVIWFQIPGFRAVVLVTSLVNPAQATTREIAELYTKRWAIEIVYRELKHGLNINNIRSRNFFMIQKEICAQMIANNLIRYVMQESASVYGFEDARLAVNYSFKRAFSAFTKMIAVALSGSPIASQKLFDNLLREIAEHPIPKRPGRHYPRPLTGKERSRRAKDRKLQSASTHSDTENVHA